MRELGGIGRIVVERDYQRTKWSDEHDDRHVLGELAEQAAALAAVTSGSDITDVWGLRKKHRSDMPAGTGARIPGRIRQLEIAGALIAAEIDRLLRVVNKDDD